MANEELTPQQREEATLKFWEENKIFEKSLAQRRKAKPFVFFEGPPTANGRPGIHHFIGRARVFITLLDAPSKTCLIATKLCAGILFCVNPVGIPRVCQ